MEPTRGDFQEYLLRHHKNYTDATKRLKSVITLSDKEWFLRDASITENGITSYHMNALFVFVDVYMSVFISRHPNKTCDINQIFLYFFCFLYLFGVKKSTRDSLFNVFRCFVGNCIVSSQFSKRLTLYSQIFPYSYCILYNLAVVIERFCKSPILVPLDRACTEAQYDNLKEENTILFNKTNECFSDRLPDGVLDKLSDVYYCLCCKQISHHSIGKTNRTLTYDVISGGNIYCNRKKKFKTIHCIQQPCWQIRLLGKVLISESNMYMFCPQPGCHHIINLTNVFSYNEYGPVCDEVHCKMYPHLHITRTTKTRQRHKKKQKTEEKMLRFFSCSVCQKHISERFAFYEGPGMIVCQKHATQIY